MKLLCAVEVVGPADVQRARERARALVAALGLQVTDQSRWAIAVREVADQVLTHGGGGRVELGLALDEPAVVAVVRGLDADGAPLGLSRARQLVDELRHQPTEAGTAITLVKRLGPGLPLPDARALERLAAQLEGAPEVGAQEALAQHQAELCEALLALASREAALGELAGELEQTNRGVVALHAELEERAQELKRLSETKSRFLSSMSHEFRTPVGSIISLAELLLERVDGPLTPEQQRQIGLISGSAKELSQLVDDLLDMAKVESGRVELRPEPFAAAELLSNLRAVLAPLLRNPAVQLSFEAEAGLAELNTDRVKALQIVRNFVTNALKFTEQGQVQVRAVRGPGDTVLFSVRDTGVGIAPQDQERIFDDFTQVEHPLQQRVQGTGLGLPLARRLAHLLGGKVLLQSALGAGSTFSVLLPRVLPSVRPPRHEAATRQVLLCDADPAARHVLRQALGPGVRCLSAAALEQAVAVVRRQPPELVIADAALDGLPAAQLLRTLREACGQPLPAVLFTATPAAQLAGIEGVVAVVARQQPSQAAFEEALTGALERAGIRRP